jgi:hypothetical protein
MSANTVPISFEPLELDEDHLHERAESQQDSSDSKKARRPGLQLVPNVFRKGAHSRVALAATAMGTIALILASQLILSIWTSEGAYTVSSLQLQQRDLARVERVLSQHVEKLSSPQNLAENAAQLGMVINATPSYLRLSDGAVLGQLGTTAKNVSANSVPNAVLVDLPLVSATGLMLDRDSAAGGVDSSNSVAKPVTWEGLLPAPQTR